MGIFRRFEIGMSLPEGYRLATVAEVVQHGHELNIRCGKWEDVQDFDNDYFTYYCRPLDFEKTRLKDGFIDNRRNLVWRKFGGLCVVDKLAVAIAPTDIKSPSSPSPYSSLFSMPNISEDDHRVVALLYACVEEDVDEIKEVVREHGKEMILVNLDGVPCRGNALHLCAWEAKIKSLEFLLKAVDKEKATKAVANLDGETPLLVAAFRGWESVVKMLLRFDKTQINMPNKSYGSTPLAAAISWSQSLGVCKDLLEVKEIEIDWKSQEENTALHLVVRNSPLRGNKNVSILGLLLHHCGFDQTESFVDKVAQEAGQLAQLSESFIKTIGDSNRQVRSGRFQVMSGNKRSFVNIQNEREETPLHHALSGISSLPTIVLQLVAMLIWAGTDIAMPDSNGRTVLHHVCKIKTVSKVESSIVRILRECFEDGLKWLEYARIQDLGGETSLHKAAFSGNKDVVFTLLSFPGNKNNQDQFKIEAKKLVHERSFDGKTTLHSAVMSEGIDATDKMEIVKKLVEHAATTSEDPERYFLFWTVAENLGTTQEMCEKGAYQSAQLESYFRLQRTACMKVADSFLQKAFDLRRHDIIVDVFNKNPNMRTIPFKGKEVLSRYEEKYKTITSDQPASQDLLERKDIACAIATLLLNQRTGSPITIGIFGGTGMGKSSLMTQVQFIMLEMAANQAVKLLETQQGNTTKEQKCFKTSRSSKELRHDVIKVVKDKFEDKIKQDGTENEILEKILSTYKPELSPIFKRLAFGNTGNDYSDRPALLTIEYNASQYEKQDEAWAGLAVEISKEMVRSCMTVGQEFRISWLYAFRKNPQLFWINLILPTILTVFLGGFIGWLAWKLLSIPNSPLLKKFQYGSIPLSVFLVVWFVMKKILKEVKPVSETLGSEYKSLYSMNEEKLGLQNRVIEDIQFLQKQVYNPASFIWNWIAFLSKGVTYFLAEESSLEFNDRLKSNPKKGTLRIVVFIDNLDRSKEELLTPLNTILSVCDLNAVIAFDKRKIDKGQGEGILRQLIQLPIVLPDPSVKQLQNRFLTDQLYVVDPKEKKNMELDILGEDDDDEDGDNGGGGQEKYHLESLGMGDTWDSYYTRGEIEMFQHVAKHTHGEFRSPREWKNLLNYHRLVRSILSHSNRWEKVRLMEGWKRQLILWLFFCWQWQKPMSAIIKNWSSLVKVPPQLKFVYKEKSSRVLAQLLARSSSPTQRWLDFAQERVHLHRHDGLLHQGQKPKPQFYREDKLKAIDEIHPTLKMILNSRVEQLLIEFEHPGQIRKSREEGKMLFIKKETRKKLIHMLETHQSPQDKQEKRIKVWKSMEELGRMIGTLKKGQYDVTMNGILSFQDFRFDCRAGYLQLSIPELDE